jgi:acetyltransferase
VEVIVGTKIDDQFGPVIVFGLGGVLVEVLRDVSTRVLPISPNSARRMIEELRSSALLDGYRGKDPVDRRALIRLLLIVSEVIESYPEIQELDLNPVLLHADGLSIVDARILLRPEPAPAPRRRRSSAE